MTKKRIPNIPPGDGDRRTFDGAIKENLEVIMGMRVDKIALLTGDESAVDVTKKINEIIARLQ